MEGIILIGKIDEESGEAFFDAQTDLDLGISFRPEVGGDDNEALKIKNELVAAGMAQAINNCALQVIKANADRAIGFIRDLLAIESDHICTNDPLFWRECQRHLRAESNNTSNNNSNGQVRRASDVPVEEIEISNSNSATEKEGSALDDFLALFRPTASIRRAAAKTLPRPLQQPDRLPCCFRRRPSQRLIQSWKRSCSSHWRSLNRIWEL